MGGLITAVVVAAVTAAVTVVVTRHIAAARDTPAAPARHGPPVKIDSVTVMRTETQAGLYVFQRTVDLSRSELHSLSLFHPAFASRICNTWMAFASWPARQGQQRSLRRMFQVLSWAFARSPGERSFAWARLASFRDSGLFFPRYGTFAGAAAW